jgi:hypothetical protein
LVGVVPAFQAYARTWYGVLQESALTGDPVAVALGIVGIPVTVTLKTPGVVRVPPVGVVATALKPYAIVGPYSKPTLLSTPVPPVVSKLPTKVALEGLECNRA